MSDSFGVFAQYAQRVRIVLSRTSHPGNIGAAARAMKTMGLSRLYLVTPKLFPDEVATSRSAGATDILDEAVVCDSLAQALEGTCCAAAMTARRREQMLPMRWSRQGATDLMDILRHNPGDIALVFGNETSGMTNEELALCQMPVMIPTNPEYSSLNLGAAVQVMAYELRMAAADHGQAPQDDFGERARFEDIEGFYAHLHAVMVDCGFYNPQNSKRLWPRLRRLFGRTQLERDEVNILRGFLTTVKPGVKAVPLQQGKFDELADVPVRES